MLNFVPIFRSNFEAASLFPFSVYTAVTVEIGKIKFRDVLIFHASLSCLSSSLRRNNDDGNVTMMKASTCERTVCGVCVRKLPNSGAVRSTRGGVHVCPFTQTAQVEFSRAKRDGPGCCCCCSAICRLHCCCCCRFLLSPICIKLTYVSPL